MMNKNYIFARKSVVYIATFLVLIMSLIFTDCTSKSADKIPITTKSEEALAHYHEGFDLMQKLRTQDAVYYFLKATAEDPDFALGYFMLAQSVTSPQRQTKYLEKAIELSDNASAGERYWITGMDALFKGEIEDADKYFNKIVRKYPNDEWGYNLLATSHFFGRQDYESAIINYNKVLEINPEFSQGYNMMGYAYRNLGDYETAEKYFTKYIKLINDDPNPYDSYAELLYKMGKYDESIEYYSKALEQKPDFLSSIRGIAANLTLQGKYAEAFKTLDTISDLTSDEGGIRDMNINKAVTYIDMGDFDSGLKMLENNVKDSKANEDYIALAQDYTNIGTLQLLNNKPDKALQYFEQGLEFVEMSNMSQERIYNARSNMYYVAGLVAFFDDDLKTLKENAEKYSDEVHKANNPGQIRNSYELAGLVHLLTGDYQSAIDEFEKTNQENTGIQYFKGTAYEALGDKETAQEVYKYVAEFNPLPNLQWAYVRHLALDKLEN